MGNQRNLCIVLGYFSLLLMVMRSRRLCLTNRLILTATFCFLLPTRTTPRNPSLILNPCVFVAFAAMTVNFRRSRWKWDHFFVQCGYPFNFSAFVIQLFLPRQFFLPMNIINLLCVISGIASAQFGKHFGRILLSKLALTHARLNKIMPILFSFSLAIIVISYYGNKSLI